MTGRFLSFLVGMAVGLLLVAGLLALADLATGYTPRPMTPMLAAEEVKKA